MRVLPPSLPLRRACRRRARCLPIGLILAAERLGLVDALPCSPADLLRPGLSGSLAAQAKLLPWMDRLPHLLPYLRRLHRLWAGNFRAWRLTA